MCIRNDKNKVAEIRQRITVLRLWKIIRKDDIIGIWGETQTGNPNCNKFQLGENIADTYPTSLRFGQNEGAFHCFFTRKETRRYHKYHQEATKHWPANDPMAKTKIIRVFADSSNVISVGYDSMDRNVRAISVSKMEIKSLKHQR